MSKNNKIFDALLRLIYVLDEEEVINLVELAEALSHKNVPFFILEFSGNVNYKTVAEYMEKTGAVFLPVGRKRAWYASRRLENLTGKKIEYVKLTYNKKTGYLFMFQDRFNAPEQESDFHQEFE
ncbi:MAG: hypothetical protein DRN25_02370 [Thermoplasmata archaeon]|nr:MAG: hypothetical protein DRN25_02370 [Thermoplasmata archaeon]